MKIVHCTFRSVATIKLICVVAAPDDAINTQSRPIPTGDTRIMTPAAQDLLRDSAVLPPRKSFTTLCKHWNAYPTEVVWMPMAPAVMAQVC